MSQWYAQKAALKKKRGAVYTEAANLKKQRYAELKERILANENTL